MAAGANLVSFVGVLIRRSPDILLAMVKTSCGGLQTAAIPAAAVVDE